MPSARTRATSTPQLNGVGEWPEVGLDTESLIAGGWQPIPIREYVIKLSSRCNLSCDYCYIYTKADHSWSSRPALVQRETVEATSARISQHAQKHGLRTIRIVLHGGEPLLAGVSLISDAVTLIREHLSPKIGVDLRLQTNGTLLDAALLDIMRALDIRIGVSLDGGSVHHDRHRKYADGRGSYKSVAHALRLLNLPAYRDLFAGLLCTVDLKNDPLDVYQTLLAFAPPQLDLLLPHGTWSSVPPQRTANPDTPYADWLSAVFDNWYSDPHQQTGIRLFEEIIQLLLGGRSRSDQVGISPADYLIVDTDGTLQLTDSLKTAYAGAPEIGLNVFEHAIDEALLHPSVIARQIGLSALADECRNCNIVAVCGGGHYAHRYRPGAGFKNPSVFCADLDKLIGHIWQRISPVIQT